MPRSIRMRVREKEIGRKGGREREREGERGRKREKKREGEREKREVRVRICVFPFFTDFL